MKEKATASSVTKAFRAKANEALERIAFESGRFDELLSDDIPSVMFFLLVPDEQENIAQIVADLCNSGIKNLGALSALQIVHRIGVAFARATPKETKHG